MSAIIRNGRKVWPRKTNRKRRPKRREFGKPGEFPKLEETVARIKEQHGIFESFDIGTDGAAFATRWEVFALMKIGEAQFFRAEGDVARASVRGSAYGFANSIHGRREGLVFVCRHVKPDIVGVYREA